MHLTFPVVCRVQVNNKGTLMLTGSTGDGVLENILWPDIPYITDQNGSKRTFSQSLVPFNYIIDVTLSLIILMLCRFILSS